jgi:hypothetical protein
MVFAWLFLTGIAIIAIQPYITTEKRRQREKKKKDVIRRKKGCVGSTRNTHRNFPGRPSDGGVDIEK